MKRVLLVEDEPGLARAVADNLRADGYDTTVSDRGDAALDVLGRGPTS